MPPYCKTWAKGRQTNTHQSFQGCLLNNSATSATTVEFYFHVPSYMPLQVVQTRRLKKANLRAPKIQHDTTTKPRYHGNLEHSLGAEHKRPQTSSRPSRRGRPITRAQPRWPSFAPQGRRCLTGISSTWRRCTPRTLSPSPGTKKNTEEKTTQTSGHSTNGIKQLSSALEMAR